jgi:hypothetical protein
LAHPYCLLSAFGAEVPLGATVIEIEPWRIARAAWSIPMPHERHRAILAQSGECRSVLSIRFRKFRKGTQED